MDPAVPGTLSLRDCLALAVEIERAGALQYARLALLFETHAPLRELFLSLAEDERSHEDQFERLVSRVDPSRSPSDSAGSQLQSLALHRFFTGPRTALSGIERARCVRDVLEVALRFELDTLEFFTGLRAQLSEPQEREHLDLLVESERAHARRLESMLRM